MPPLQPPLPIAPSHNNQQLFSDYYLNIILPQRPEWKLLVADVQPTMDRIAAILGRYTPSDNEAQLERELVRPILEALGHTFEVQASLRTPEGTKRPDYIFYPNQATVDANKAVRVLTKEQLAPQVMAVGDAKAWLRSLDAASADGNQDAFNKRNPSAQIDFYIRHSGATWGILTNGKYWRLYHKDSSDRLDRFYEVDLEHAVTAHDPATFLYFYAFFHRSAFDPHPFGLAALLQASTDYARGVGNTLKRQVYEALRHLAQGFLDYPQNQLQSDPVTLKQIYDHGLIVLYRLLFILYAESRELLPIRESPLYRDRYSLYAITHDVARDLQAGVQLLPTSSTLWPRLKTLFGIINVGSPPLKVATFNGGLFDPQHYPFLEQYTVGDFHLQQAIDQLARVHGQFIDYRDLAERHLGTIYEGLLEYHLEAQPPVQGWTIDLLNTNGERKQTGSFYTPEYIVAYIVDQTVGPVLRAAVENEADDAAKIAAVLNLNVLDPAMGSGHFLVSATEYIARFLVDLAVLPEAGAPEEADIAYWKRRVVSSCIYGVDLNPLAVDLAKLSLWLSTIARDRPLSFLDHHLRVGNALVGARLEDLRVTGDNDAAPRRRRARRAPDDPQLVLFDEAALRDSLRTAVGAMAQIEHIAGDTIDEVRAQERAYAELRETLTRKYGRLANLVTATHFGQPINADVWKALADYATGRTIAAPRQFDDWLQTATTLAGQHHFFHWELEFPEVFFDQTGQPLGARAGFDAVIGNPPYVRQEDIAPIKPYLKARYTDTYHGVADLFVYFFRQAVQLLHQDGWTSYISSNSWLRANYAGPLRAFLRTQTTIETIIDLGDNRVFAEAPDVYPAIHIVRRSDPPADHQAQAAVFTRGEGVQHFSERVATKFFPVTIHDQADTGWQLGEDVARKVFTKLMANGKSFGDTVEGRIYYGVKTGFNDAFIIDKTTRDQLVNAEPQSAEIIKPLLRGEDLRPWYQEDEGRWLIFARRGIDIDAYPGIKAHLERFREQLEPRPKDWDTNEIWLGRKPGAYQWYEIQDSVDYYQEFANPKIFWPDIAKFPRFSWDNSEAFVNDKGYIAVPQNTFVLGILQSRITWLCISQLCVPLGERAGLNRYQLKTQFISRLPIPDPPEIMQEVISSLAISITEQGRARYDLDRRVQRRVLADLGVAGKRLNKKLLAWWNLDFATFRAEIKNVFRREIPLRERDDWEAWLGDNIAVYRRHTDEIIRLETALNAQVYTLFDLSPEEIEIVEANTKYRYGEG